VSDRAALASAILDNLAADTPRLVFADWLDEHGEAPRAEFIRAQIAAASLPADSAPARRAAELLAAHGPAWATELGLPPFYDDYVRGVLTNVDATHRMLPAWAPALQRVPFTVKLLVSWAVAPDVPATPEWMAQFAANPALRAVTEIGSETGGLGAALFVPLMRSPHLRNVWKIRMFEDNIGAAGVRAIAESPSPFVLRSLGLNSGIGDPHNGNAADSLEAVRVLASHPRFASLTELDLPFNALGPACAEVLLASQTLSPNLVLGIGANPIDNDHYRALLAQRFQVTDFV
jgi:uncharacterized protein (TIGR02996 family)